VSSGLSPMKRGEWLTAFQRAGIEEVYYLASISNVHSIIAHGILPLDEIRRRNIAHIDISAESVQSRREMRGLHSWTPLYFAYKTPMSYVLRDKREELCLAAIGTKEVVDLSESLLYSDGNAASAATKILLEPQRLADRLPLDVIRAPRWVDFAGGRRKRSAELLVAPNVPPEALKTIFVSTRENKECVDEALFENGCRERTECIVDPGAFFSPDGTS
jgi:hypothetical protein